MNLLNNKKRRKISAFFIIHNNDIGIQIALTTPTDAAEIENEIEKYLGENETMDDLRTMFNGYSDREILFIKKAINAVYS